ncbi:MAG: (2Fe-2S)-binding protein [Alphaproteobacteria bacterium]|nr:(2Fe-2S)-binding protein [Alphaproteobacteria bacterium]
MPEDCRTSHAVCSAHNGGEHSHEIETTRCNPLQEVVQEIARSKASRRTFIKGVVASGTAMGASGYLFRSGEAQAQARGAGAVERLVSLNVNGQTRRVDVLPHETLAITLRTKLGLTGTKLACDRGECGSCNVMIGDTTVYSCTTLTHQVADKPITTVEGIAKEGKLHPVQKAFIEEIGPQCGYCTPGQVISAVALLNKNPKPTIEEARRAMSGNLCRCGSYQQYLAGLMRASKEM